MFQLIRLGTCVHVFDTKEARFVKRSFTNVRLALGSRATGTTRNELIRNAQWVRCMDPHCQFRCCRDGGHWIAQKS